MIELDGFCVLNGKGGDWRKNGKLRFGVLVVYSSFSFWVGFCRIVLMLNTEYLQVLAHIIVGCLLRLQQYDYCLGRAVDLSIDFSSAGSSSYYPSYFEAVLPRRRRLHLQAG